MVNQDLKKIGRFLSSMEDGKLKLYYHPFGNGNGFSCTLEAEEAMGLLDMLSRHREDIHHALYVNETQSSSSHDYVSSRS